MSEKTIWVVRVVGIVVFLVLVYLMMSLYTRLVELNEETGSNAPSSSSSARIPADLVFVDAQRV